MSSLLAHLLGKHLQRTHTSVNRLALLSGIPQRTIANWLSGYIRKPHQWQSVVKVALALHLTEPETNELLRAVERPSLTELRAKATKPTDRAILAKFNPSHFSGSSPFQVIADNPTFVGRSIELEQLKDALRDGGRATICGLRGMAGVGKTTLAAHLAYQLEGEFPDGVLWARLDTSDSLSILGAFAEAYGKDVSRFRDAESRAAVVRNLLAKKRALIILDNAETSDQVRILLPPSNGNCAVLLTTRHDLSVLDGWKKMVLQPFDSSSDESMQLFERYLGRDFVHRHRAALMEIATILGHLPLPLAIIAGQLTSSMSDSAAAKEDSVVVMSLLDTLRVSYNRLDVLKRENLEVRASFESSYNALTLFQQKLFSSLGVFSGEDFDSAVVARLQDEAAGMIEDELNRLHAISLVQKSHAGRWRLHPLLKDFVREKLEASGRMRLVVEKVLSIYRQAVQGQWSFNRPLDAEIPNIRFALEKAVELKLYQPLLETVQLIYPTLYSGAWYSLASTALGNARHAASTLGDRKAEIYFLKGLSLMQIGLGDTKSGRENLNLALRLAQSKNRENDIAEILCSLGKLEHDTGYRRKARLYFQKSLMLARKIGDLHLISRNLNNLATNLMADARFEEARKMYLESLEIARNPESGNPIHKVLMNLGELFWCQGDLVQAEKYWQEALALARAGRYRAGTAVLLTNLAGVRAVREDWAGAERFCDEAVRLAVEIHSPRVEGIARSELGEIFRKQKKYHAAMEQLTQARVLTIEADDSERKGIVLRYLGLLYLDGGNLKDAHAMLDMALTTAREIDHKVMIADGCFIQSKILLASGRHDDAKRLAREGFRVYRQLGLSRQSNEVRVWMQLLTNHSRK